MKLQDYLDVNALEEQIVLGNVNRNFHKKFTNLAIYTYSKGCTMNYAWNDITCKCRGLIVDTSTWEIIARPFEKFFNLGEDKLFPEYNRENLPPYSPTITDKLDGNLITLYFWAGRWWAASKGSFHSEHADWANNWYATHTPRLGVDAWPGGYTPVFEMIAEGLEHHVVHYGREADGLYLLALIHKDTGAELNPWSKKVWAGKNDIIDVPILEISMDKALLDNEKNAEGYVLTWSRGPMKPPFRVKVKFGEFLRLQKLVHNIGPKEILDYMRHPHLQCYLQEALNPETSHEEFIKYTRTWMSLFEADLNRVGIECNYILTDLYKKHGLTLQMPRKLWAEQILKCKYPAIMFAQLDYELAALRADWTAEKNEQHKKRIKDLMWDQVEPLSKQFDDVRSIITQEE